MAWNQRAFKMGFNIWFGYVPWIPKTPKRAKQSAKPTARKSTKKSPQKSPRKRKLEEGKDELEISANPLINQP